ncbi:dTMP kinase [Hasllibacter halocynthiae]|uniref:Thymidylate kinase n=1 Tax=Hasllibacter halocynthiae TaxID=595589 RepID=A0A2T0X6Y6_9RHOB|nr:dTMP kinase [Hasllibacter halocynthiae]PRY94708.1 dTMP kinase [Hasllibacter halocynthiae]
MTARFISFEGIDGSGKSTQARMLADAMRGRGEGVVLTREPGGSTGAEEIRALVLTGDPGRWSPETEICLFTAARRDHLERRIIPALQQGRTVITDRFADSTRAYQGGEGTGHAGLVDTLHRAMIGLEPDRTFIVDLPPEEGLKRSYLRAARAEEASRLDPQGDPRSQEEEVLLSQLRSRAGREAAEMRFESLGLPFQQRLRANFFAIAKAFPDRIRVIDGSGTPEAVHARVLAAL